MEYSVITNMGDREHNEDCADGKLRTVNGTKYGCFVLADGLGGHGRGEVASQLVVGTIMQMFEESDDMENFLPKALSESQRALLELQRRERAFHEMKTTAVTLLISNDQIYWAHVGDSRLYYFRNKKLITRTLDHSVPQMLATAGDIKEKEIRKHPDRNKLLRVMGTDWDEPKYIVSDVIENVGNQAFLLCSDGFWENIDEKKMQKCLKKSDSAEKWLVLMNEIVQKNGRGMDMDNNTAIAVFV